MVARVRKNSLDRINEEVVACRKCARLVAHREHIGQVKRRAFRDEDYWARPVPALGDRDAGLVLVGLAPAAHGANRTGRMFTGDRSGEWLYRALFRAGFASQPDSTHLDDGLVLRDVYITAAAHCAPPDNKPTRVELETCSTYLVAELAALLAARRGRGELVVLALGQIGFRACLGALATNGVEIPRPQPRFGHGASYSLRPGLTLMSSYHPSQQNTQTGRLTEPMLDSVFERAKSLLR
jgi:uracil-DNA glycosylase family 4